MNALDARQFLILIAGGCPECGEAALIGGHRGGDSRNVACVACGMEYNVAPRRAEVRGHLSPERADEEYGILRRCRVCKCTEHNACPTLNGPCHWIQWDLCSACEGKAMVTTPSGLVIPPGVAL